MPEPSQDILIDQFLDQMLRGVAPTVDAFPSVHGVLSGRARLRLRRLAVPFGGGAAGKLTHLEQRELEDEPLPFARLGRYRLIRKLAQGGMGAVYLVEQEPLARCVALKIIRPELAASPLARQRFAREVLTIARLKHPNIVTIHDAGEEGGVAYLAMDLVPGRGLDQLLRESAERGERVNVVDAVRHARDIARALVAAHAVGIVHRDIK